MKVDIIMPKLGESIAEATILKWLKKAGEAVTKDETILEISTDKVDSDIPSPDSGYISRIIANEGDTVEVGSVIAEIVTEQSELEVDVVEPVASDEPTEEASPPPILPPVAPKPFGVTPIPEEDDLTEPEESTTESDLPTMEPNEPDAPKPEPETPDASDEPAEGPAESAEEETGAAADTATEQEKPFYSPVVRAVAAMHGVNEEELSTIEGTGAGGRITRQDILSYVAQNKEPIVSPVPPLEKIDGVPHTVIDGGVEYREQESTFGETPSVDAFGISKTEEPKEAPTTELPAIPDATEKLPEAEANEEVSDVTMDATNEIQVEPHEPEPIEEITVQSEPDPAEEVEAHAETDETEVAEVEEAPTVAPDVNFFGAPTPDIEGVDKQPALAEAAEEAPADEPVEAEKEPEPEPVEPQEKEPEAIAEKVDDKEDIFGVPTPLSEVDDEAGGPKLEKASTALGGRTRREPMDHMRKLIAEHMISSVRTSPHVYSITEVDMKAIVDFREKVKEVFLEKEGFKLTYTPFIIRAAARALREYPYVNSSIEGDEIVLKDYVNVGIAVALEKGLIVPVIKDADRLDLRATARALDDLSKRARTKKLLPDEVQDGTFSITNMGVFGSLAGFPIINQPQLAILGIGAIKKKPVVHNDAIAISSVMQITLGFDHRLVDGAMGGMFLERIGDILTNFDPTVGI